MLKESSMKGKKEEVGGLSQFLSVICSVQMGGWGCLGGHFRKMIYGVYLNSDSETELYVSLKPFGGISFELWAAANR